MAPIFCGDSVQAELEGCGLLDDAQAEALLEHLTEKHDELKDKRYELKRIINQFRSPIISRLPPDVMSTIFEFCVPHFADLQLQIYPARRAHISVPLCLGAICSYWREIAWSTPCLWSSLVVDVIAIRRIVDIWKRDLRTTLIQEWLARSGQLPLSIRIISYNDRDPFSFSATMDVINQYSARWSDLHLRAPQSFFRYVHAADNHAPILKSITIDSDSRRNLTIFQLTCPRLERANLYRYQIIGTNTSIQWDNVTHINLRSMYTIDCFLILQQTPRLVVCTISYCYAPPNIIERLANTTLILPSLRSLLVTGSLKFIDCLVTAQLEELSLSDHHLSMEAIISFFKRSVCPLRSFSTTLTRNASFEVFISLLRLMPSLKRLAITFEKPTNPFSGDSVNLRSILQLVARVLSSQSTTIQQGLLPNLEILEYTVERHLRSGFSPDPLYTLPSTDNPVRGPFHLLKLNIPPTTCIPKGNMSYFLSLAERGVKVDFWSESTDILQSSVDFHREREELLSRDWADDLDLGLMHELEPDCSDN